MNWSATKPASLIKQYELLVDGKSMSTVPGTAASAKATLALGTHKVAVRTVHQSGNTAASAAATVTAETTAPSFTTKPTFALRNGTVNTTGVPLTLAWKATDAAALKEVRLTAPVAKAYGPASYSAIMARHPELRPTAVAEARTHGLSYAAWARCPSPSSRSPTYSPHGMADQAAPPSPTGAGVGPVGACLVSPCCENPYFNRSWNV
ncbi:hypothetical protein ACIP6P_24695 [Streptomyces sp. NPDC088729]|uniref:hypothetical protein n=1 Tax=Streptomyces sp. NPDC088729 TaxID=3365876 RepID=UPI0037FA8FBC